MASTIDICNLSLQRLGQRGNIASIDPPEDGNDAAESCAAFFNIAKNDFLETFPWSFAVKRGTLSELTETPIGYRQAYKLPADCLRVIQMLYIPSEQAVAGQHGAQRLLDAAEWDVELVSGGPALLTDASPDAVRYISTEVDVNRFSPLAVDALSWLLASHLAGSLLKGAAGMQMAQSCMQFYSATVDAAIKADLQRQSKRPHYITPFAEDYQPSYRQVGLMAPDYYWCGEMR